MRRTPYESAAAPMSHSAADPAEFNAVCRSKSNLPNRTDSNAALLPYLTHQLGSAHEWSGVWNGPDQCATNKLNYFSMKRVISHRVWLFYCLFIYVAEKMSSYWPCIFLSFKGNKIWACAFRPVMSSPVEFISFA